MLPFLLQSIIPSLPFVWLPAVPAAVHILMTVLLIIVPTRVGRIGAPPVVPALTTNSAYRNGPALRIPVLVHGGRYHHVRAFLLNSLQIFPEVAQLLLIDIDEVLQVGGTPLNRFTQVRVHHVHTSNGTVEPHSHSRQRPDGTGPRRP